MEDETREAFTKQVTVALEAEYEARIAAGVKQKMDTLYNLSQQALASSPPPSATGKGA